LPKECHDFAPIYGHYSGLGVSVPENSVAITNLLP
jgi:hypothetical protein